VFELSAEGVESLMGLGVLSSLFESLGSGETVTHSFVPFLPGQDIIRSASDGLDLALKTDLEKLFVNRAPAHRAEEAKLLEKGEAPSLELLDRAHGKPPYDVDYSLQYRASIPMSSPIPISMT
jgi:hypothetical protein